MDKNELIQKIIQKKEFSQLPLKDVELAFEKFDKPRNADYQKIKLTRQFLRKIFSGFSSRKVLHKRDENAEWFLMKHKSTKERYPYCEEVYSRCFKNFPQSFSVFDLGAGINGLSYNYMVSATPFSSASSRSTRALTLDMNNKQFVKSKHSPPHDNFNEKNTGLGFSSASGNVNDKISSKSINYKIDYIGIEAVGQFVELMNFYFEKEKINGIALCESLFELNKIKEIIKKDKNPKIIFLFKVIDSLELMKRDYSKELLSELMPLADRIVVSFATHSLGARKKFSVNRNWLLKFINENFKVLDDFELGGERYLVFESKIPS